MAIYDALAHPSRWWKMPKMKCQTCAVQGKVPACAWGDTQDYTDLLEILSERDAVKEGSTFMSELGLKTCLVTINFFSIEIFQLTAGIHRKS